MCNLFRDFFRQHENECYKYHPPAPHVHTHYRHCNNNNIIIMIIINNNNNNNNDNNNNNKLKKLHLLEVNIYTGKLTQINVKTKS